MNANLKVKPEDFAGLDISSLPDQPSLTSTELKARFDSPAKVVLSGKLNRVIDALSSQENGDSGAHHIGSAPIDGLNNSNGKSATLVHDQLCALQKGILDIVDNNIPINSLDGSKIVDGTISPEKLDGTFQATLELPIAPGEKLTTPCVVKIGKNGVETPKPSFMRGSKSIWYDNQSMSGDNTLYQPVITQLFESYAIFSYNKYIAAGNYQPNVVIGKLEGGFLLPVITIHAGASLASVGQANTTYLMVKRAAAENTWLVGFVDQSMSTTFIYAFKFDGTSYQYISRYEGLYGLGWELGRFLALSDNKIILKYFQTNLNIVAVKFTGTGFVQGTPVAVHTSNSKVDMVRLSDSRFLVRPTSTSLRLYYINDLSLTAGNSYSYSTHAVSIIALSETRFAYFFQPANSILSCLYIDIDGNGNFTANAAKQVCTCDYYTQIINLGYGYVLFIYLDKNYSTGLRQMSACLKCDVNDVKVLGLGSWPYINVSSIKADQIIPQQNIGSPYFVSSTLYNSTEGAMMKFGIVEFTSVLEPLDWVGMAVSQKDGKAKVLVDTGVVTGFSGLKRGKTYCIGFDGGLNDFYENPVSVKIGKAIDENTLLFIGNKPRV